MSPEERAARRQRTRERVEREGKYCRGPCQKLRPAAGFATREAAIDGRQSWCRDCTAISLAKHRAKYPDRAAEKKRARYANDPEKHRATTKAWRDANPDKWRDISLRSQRVNAWASNLVSHCRHRTKKLGLPECDLSGDYLLALFKKQRGLCYWLGIPMVPSVENRDPRRPSIDRIVTARGYVRGNVVLATSFANMGRSAYDAKRFAVFVKELKRRLKSD